MKSSDEAIDFIQHHPFGILITASNDIPLGTHLPITLEMAENDIYLHGHWAKANDQWKNANGKMALIIFPGEHAYVSPTLYQKKEEVPTWNYLAVHAYGKLEIITNEAEILEKMSHMIKQLDTTYFQQWKELSLEYKNKMVQHTVGFKLRVTELQGKKKISQNKSDVDQQSIYTHFSQSEKTDDKILATKMKNIFPHIK